MTTRKSTTERKKQILDVTLTIIYEEGFQALTIRKIAEKIGITEAALYKHFNSKKEIITSLINKLFKENVFYEKIDEKEKPEKVLLKIMKRQFSYLSDRPKMTAILFSEEIFREYPEIKDKFIKQRDKREKILTDFIKKAQKRRKIPQNLNAHNFALLYMGSIRISVLRWKNKDFSYSLEEQAKIITDTLFKLLKTQEVYNNGK